MIIDHMQKYPEHVHLLTEGRTSPNLASAVLWSILAVLPVVLPAAEIPTLPAFKDIPGPLQPSVGAYVDKWNRLKPAQTVSESSVWVVLALVLQQQMPEMTAAAGGASSSAAVDDTEARLSRLVISLNECKGTLTKGMADFNRKDRAAVENKKNAAAADAAAATAAPK